MGKKGLRKLGKIKAIGSVSRNIAENSHIPVVLVDKSDKNLYRKILVPYDLQDSKLSNLVLENALIMQYSTKECQIVVVNIIPEIPIPPFASDIQMKSKITGDAISVREYFKELYQEIKKDTEIEIRKRIGKDMNNIEIRTSYGNIADKLIEFIEKEDIDFVIMGLNPLKGISKIVALGSVSRRLAESIDCPIMLIR
jgi:nucleotide-binding universal stress UspA family protein